ncbi:hypothetical protein P153DRAFT_393448 [Dothidotthia symphoricarpi CBS 119687]|uniref:Zn(2)-C6 fungal-type domain-containing protein n=1 Tax=Dothidotthia symphoricarpi CBS 119687 TaxID=1392245 RepID=A0A6A6AQ32_9PLEO|nr:uncharacterized protein P153DRAFT_393448 [Dothidotthia symphoricarpi CBS 119687]KAF2133646.1 hypothetical protein P153DRAFT_393448 [Dothidotthia symphoricarpi CBS 119687]
MFSPSSAPAPKLRDSCDACASSKLKCHKQKPVCSRCAKRGIACNYLATRRAGRRYDSRRSDRRRPDSFSPIPESQLDQLDIDAWFGANTVAGSCDDYFLGPSTALSTGTGVNPDPDLTSHLPSPVNNSVTIPNLDHYLPSPTSFWVPDTSSTDVLGQIGGDFFSVAASVSHDESDRHNEDVINVRPIDEQNEQHENFTSIETQKSGSRIDTTFACCLTQAMTLLQRIFSQPSTVTENACKNTQAENDLATNIRVDGNHLPPTDVVIATNKQTMDAVAVMLQCSCSQNGYLLAIISLIVFKVLDFYGAAANTSHGPTNHKPDEDSTYMTVQLVLGELHRVQRLVNQFSAKMKEQTALGASDIQDKGTMTTALCGERQGNDVSTPFSKIMSDQLEIDLRKRLKSLSMGLVAHLRRD